MRWLLTSLAGLSLLYSSNDSAEALLRDAVNASQAERWQTAEVLYSRALAVSDDPAQVAYNRGVSRYFQGDYREAERDFLRCLSDPTLESYRRTEAVYNRGVCLLNCEPSVDHLRTAIACFERAVHLSEPSSRLHADARYNLELAKLLWNRERAASSRSHPPPGDGPPEAPEPTRTGSDNDQTTLPSSPDDGPGDGEPEERTGDQPDGNGRDTERDTPGRGTLPVLIDLDTPQALSPDDTRLILDVVGERLGQDRAAASRKAIDPGEQPNVRDW